MKSLFRKRDKPLKKRFLTFSDNNLTIPERFFKWINMIESENSPNESIKALNFGLFETTNSYMMYLMGAEKFDENDENWACKVDYEPKYKYLDLNDSKLNESGWEYVLDFSVSLISKYLKENKSFLTKIENITAGFDDGNLTKIK
ncbi:hypothetical protein [Pontimicrobium sp. SW4]|uniref:DUF4304 domain-containing protein n=1 Tax=Pontimicrobium sp. SW4 TaxID=3153519 RepID=A0AAU7BRF2_9FLAO